jgi:hypothetical protein
LKRRNWTGDWFRAPDAIFRCGGFFWPRQWQFLLNKKIHFPKKTFGVFAEPELGLKQGLAKSQAREIKTTNERMGYDT